MGDVEKGETLSEKKCYFSTSKNILIAQKIKIGSTLTSEKITFEWMSIHLGTGLGTSTSDRHS